MTCLPPPPAATLPIGDLYALAAVSAAVSAAAASLLGDEDAARLFREQAVLRARTAAQHRERRRGWGITCD